MSSFLMSAAGGPGDPVLLRATDERANAPSYQWTSVARVLARPWEDGALWPSSRFGGSDQSQGIAGLDFQTSGKWAAMPDEAGGDTQKKLTGTTRDSSGAALGSVTVSGYLTATGALVGTVVSDSAGYFELPTPYSGSHYLVAYKSGSPDVSGTTANNLTPV